jgi:hypothetical protein
MEAPKMSSGPEVSDGLSFIHARRVIEAVVSRLTSIRSRRLCSNQLLTLVCASRKRLAFRRRRGNHSVIVRSCANDAAVVQSDIHEHVQLHVYDVYMYVSRMLVGCEDVVDSGLRVKLRVELSALAAF